MVVTVLLVTVLAELYYIYTRSFSSVVSALDLPSEKDLHKILQVLEPHVSFLEDLTKMGGAMRSVLTQVLTSQQFYKDLSSGMSVLFLIIRFSNYEALRA